MKIISAILFAASILVSPLSAAIGSDSVVRDSNTKSVEGSYKKDLVLGGDRDIHGCIGSAGYVWSSTTSSCVRPWEEGKINKNNKEVKQLCKEFIKDLKLGDGTKNKKHQEVKDLQDRLIGLGYLNGSSTGYFGKDTQKALKAFQKDNGILNSGNFGPLTKKALSKRCITNITDIPAISSTTTATSSQ